MLTAPNFSIGVAVFDRVVAEAARLFAKLEGFDAHLVETHHATKKDAPSGTAGSLAHTAEELLDKLIPAGMPCSAAYKVSDVMQSPHAKARGSVLEVDYPGIGPVKSAANPIKLSDAPVETRLKSPMVGEHTVEIMREVGFSDAEIAALRNAKAVATS